MAPTGLQEALAETVFHTGDKALNELLEDARHKFLNRDLKVRRESLEKLWDAWERLKTIEPGKDKKVQATALLAKASIETSFQERLKKEARELTDIGNKFMIRHTETDKVPISESAHRLPVSAHVCNHSSTLEKQRSRRVNLEVIWKGPIYKVTLIAVLGQGLYAPVRSQVHRRNRRTCGDLHQLGEKFNSCI